MRSAVRSTTLISLSITAVVLLGACGTETISRSTLSKAIVASAEKSGDTLDEGCVSDAVAKLNDADLKILDKAMKADAEPTDLSGDGLNVMFEVVACSGSISGESLPEAIEGLTTAQGVMLDTMLKQFEQSGIKVDKACLQDMVKGLSNEQVTKPSEEATQKLITEAVACLQG